LGVSSRLYVTLGIFAGRGGSSVGTNNTVSWSDRVTAGSIFTYWSGIWYQVGTLVKTLSSTEEPRVAQVTWCNGKDFR